MARSCADRSMRAEYGRRLPTVRGFRAVGHGDGGASGRAQSGRGVARSSCSAHELMQYRCPLGRGPSLKTWPRCEPQRRHRTSVRTIKNARSRCNVTATESAGSAKLGQPVPEFELGVRVEQRRAARRAPVPTVVVTAPVLAGERALGAALAQHPVLRGGQLVAPLLVRLGDLGVHGHSGVGGSMRFQCAETPSRCTGPAPGRLRAARGGSRGTRRGARGGRAGRARRRRRRRGAR